MKNLTIIMMAATLIFSACGDKDASAEAKAAIEKRNVTPELQKLITNLAACESQNSNCEAYNTASTEIQKMSDVEAKKETLIGDLIYIIQTGPNAEKQAAAHALSFWMGIRTYRDNAAYGDKVIEALKALKIENKDGYDYTGSQVGALMSSWWENKDAGLRTKMIAYMTNKSGDRSARSEMIRLLPYKIISEDAIFTNLVKLVNDETEDKLIRNSAITSLSMVEDETKQKTVQTLLEGYLLNKEIEIAGSAMRGLGYLNAAGSIDKIIGTLRANKDEKGWYSYGSGCLSDLLREPAEGLDQNVIFDFISEMIAYDAMEAYYRSYYISPLHKMESSAAKSLMAKLKKSKEEDLKKEAERVSKY